MAHDGTIHPILTPTTAEINSLQGEQGLDAAFNALNTGILPNANASPQQGNIFQTLGQGALAIGGGFKDFFTKSDITTDASGQAVQGLTGFQKISPALDLANQIYQFRELKELQGDILSENRAQNRRQTLSQIANANRATGSREFRRLQAQGLSTEDARAGAKEYVTNEGFTPEQFGVKTFSKEEDRRFNV